ncbi:alpha/beta hydrolase [Nocardia sp. NPDC005745]|uniref:alpha/beta hydrolase n=1 Tax=Nocardia sp. NPDC005745 TaxID=3157061 RepID=UPI0033ED38A8
MPAQPAPIEVLDPEAAIVIAARAAIPAADLSEMRLKYETVGRRFAPEVPPDMSVRDIEIEFRDTGSVSVRSYLPAGAPVTEGLLVWAHGGGWIIGSAAGFDGTAAALAAHSGTRTLSIDYSLAPENPFPCALDEVRAVIDWVRTAEASDMLGHDPARVVVGGDSAGGNLITVAAAQASGAVPLAGQVLAYPVTDCRVSTASDTPSPALTAEALTTCWQLYLGDTERAPHPDFSPIHGDLAGLPPTLLVLAGLDILYDTGVIYGQALRAAGVPTEIVTYSDLPHVFLEWAREVRRSRHAHALIGDFVRARVA